MLKKLYISLFVDDLIPQSVVATTAVTEPLKMKLWRDLSRLTLLSYILYFLNPVMPIIADKMAHTFWEEYHMITVHGVYGKFHVQMQLDKTEKQDAKEKSSRNNKPATEEYVNVFSCIHHPVLPAKYIVSGNTPYKCYLPVSFTDIDYLPPKA